MRSLHARIMACVIGASGDFTARNGNVLKRRGNAHARGRRTGNRRDRRYLAAARYNFQSPPRGDFLSQHPALPLLSPLSRRCSPGSLFSAIFPAEAPATADARDVT